MDNPIDIVIGRSEQVLGGQFLPERSTKFKKYAVTNFRGGIGKSTISFNLSYELSRQKSCLLLDTCSQKNFSQNVFGESLSSFDKTLYDALIVSMTNSGTFQIDDVVVSVKPHCQSFSGGRPCFMIPGSTELFLFPSLLYSQFAQYAQLGATYERDASARTLMTIARIIEQASEITKPEKILIDTSPFFGGATHLSWAAADALIIPVRVDQNSVEALALTLEMLRSQTMDFHKFNKQSGIVHCPKVHAIVMTHCGWNRQRKNTPDSSTRFFVQKSLEIAQKYHDLFSEQDITSCFYLLDDFHSSGRISGKQRIPLSQLKSGQKYIVDGQRLEVNPSVDRYQKEIQNLADAL